MEILRQFEARDGTIFALWDGVWSHIQKGHPEIRTPEEIGDVLEAPDIVVQSNWSDTARLYYKQTGKYYRTVVVEVAEMRVKTAYLTDQIKSGTVLWKRKTSRDS